MPSLVLLDVLPGAANEIPAGQSEDGCDAVDEELLHHCVPQGKEMERKTGLEPATLTLAR